METCATLRNVQVHLYNFDSSLVNLGLGPVQNVVKIRALEK